jgi:hypothetical protein
MDIDKILIPLSHITEISNVRYHEKGKYAYFIITTTANKFHRKEIKMPADERKHFKDETLRGVLMTKAHKVRNELAAQLGKYIQVNVDK